MVILQLMGPNYEVWNYATTVRAEVGPNKGNKLLNGRNINLNKSNVMQSRSLNFVNSKIEFIRVIKGTNLDQSSDFFSKDLRLQNLLIEWEWDLGELSLKI